MKVETSRRRFMAFLPAALAAAPVAAKAAASKMGLEGILGGAAIGAGPPQSMGYPGEPIGDSWVQRAIKRFWKPQAVRERRMQTEYEARRLDPDLASMRSLSPSAAYAIQFARTEKRIEQRTHLSLQDQLEEEARNRIGLS